MSHFKGMIQMSCFDINLVTPHQLVVLQPKQKTDKDAAIGSTCVPFKSTASP
jgi:hypothetical protein